MIPSRLTYSGAMREENIAAARAGVAAVNRSDAEALIEQSDPAIEYRAYLAVSGEGVYRGHDGLRQFLNDLKDAWEWFEIEIDEYRPIGPNVVAIGRGRGRGRASGVEVLQAGAWVMSFRQGTGPHRCTHMQFYLESDAALDAASA
jgi:ketosteroid isomerase-like protein